MFFAVSSAYAQNKIDITLESARNSGSMYCEFILTAKSNVSKPAVNKIIIGLVSYDAQGVVIEKNTTSFDRLRPGGVSEGQFGVLNKNGQCASISRVKLSSVNYVYVDGDQYDDFKSTNTVEKWLNFTSKIPSIKFTLNWIKFSIEGKYAKIIRYL